MAAKPLQNSTFIWEGTDRKGAKVKGEISAQDPNLAKAHQLTGPQNDVRLMRDTLVKRFGVDRGRITELAGWPANTAQRPTRANILAALDRLADPNVVAALKVQYEDKE